MEVAAPVESMDTSPPVSPPASLPASPPASPPASRPASPPAAPVVKENNAPSERANDESEDSSSHHSSNDNSNGPVENNNEGSSHSEQDSKTKRNGITPEDSQCSNSKESCESQRKPKEAASEEVPNNSSAKATVAGVSDNDSKVQTNDEGSDEDGDSNEEVDSSEEGSEGSEGGATKDPVSVNSDSEPETLDDDSTKDDQSDSDNEEIVMIENTNEVHEIVSDDDDDCVVTNDSAAKSINGGSNLDIDSDVEESVEDPLNHNDKIKDSKSKAKPLQTPTPVLNNTKKDSASVVIIDTSSILSGKGPIPMETPKGTAAQPTISNQSIYESIAARGTTMTAVKTPAPAAAAAFTPQVQPVSQAPLLPTLTDDMFVVEAPSFIVPYVYEKPSVKPFREFVDVLGKELEEKRAKEEQVRLEKEKEEKEKRKKDKEERRAKGEQVEDSEEEKEPEKIEEIKEKEETPKVDEGTPKKKDKKKGKKRRNVAEEDDASWDGESASDSEEEAISEDDELTTVVIKDKDENDDIEEIKTIATNMTTESKTDGVKADSFFEQNLGKFFMNIGLNLVQEYVQADLLRQQKRKLRKEAKSTRPNTKAIQSAIGYLSKNLEFSKHQNAPYKFKQKSCKFCFFKTESALVMGNHLETPHMKNNLYTCNMCPFEVRSPHDILFHMEAEHNSRSRLERAPAYHQCANCPFEDNGKGKLARHIIACAKKFKPEVNLSPPVDWEPPAKIPKLTRARTMMPAYRPTGAPLGRPPTISGPTPQLGRPRAPTGPVPRGSSLVAGAPLVRGGVMVRQTTPIQPMSFPVAQNTAGGKIVHQPSISITPLPRAPQPTPAARTQGSFVICEICDGYIKDLEQLRSHMQWIHKVKIHPKMIYNRPPLNCQKCQFRFFTDQGLERHLLGSHGLVTSSMQETANQGKDSGRCPVCGRVYQWKLLNHVAKDHNMTLKPAHLSYKCTVCTATFGMYKQFESHVYSMHSAVGKKVADNKPAKGVAGSSVTIVPAGKPKV